MYIVNSKYVYAVGTVKVKPIQKKVNKLNRTKKLALVFGIILLLSGTIVLALNANTKSDESIGTFTDEEMKHYQWSKDKLKQTPYADSSSQTPTIMDRILKENKQQIM